MIARTIARTILSVMLIMAILVIGIAAASASHDVDQAKACSVLNAKSEIAEPCAAPTSKAETKLTTIPDTAAAPAFLVTAKERPAIVLRA